MNEIKKCLFPIAGYGTRFLPVTKTIPKEMLPILTKPLIQYAVEEAYGCGIDMMGFVTRKDKGAIEDFFDRHYDIENQIKGTSKEKLLDSVNHLINKCKFSYVRQNEIKGLGDAILIGEILMQDEPFAVILPDDLCYNDNQSILSQMVEVYQKHKCPIIAIEEIDIKNSDKYGIIVGEQIDDDLYQITDMVEKPSPSDAPSNLAIIGRYILTPDIFEILENTEAGSGAEIQITDALKYQAKHSKVLAYRFKGKRFDCGSIDGFVEATKYFYELDYK